MKHRIVHALQKYVLNPPIKLPFAIGVVPPGYALLETIGRTTGKPRQTPVGARVGNRLWIVAGHGMKAGYVRNLLRPLLQSPSEEEPTLANLPGILKQLKKERAQVERQLWGLDAAIRAFASVYSGGKPISKRREISAKGRARIAAAQRARWAKVKGQHKVVSIAKPKRTMSASARRKIAPAQRARWAKVRQQKKTA